MDNGVPVKFWKLSVSVIRIRTPDTDRICLGVCLRVHREWEFPFQIFRMGMENDIGIAGLDIAGLENDGRSRRGGNCRSG